MTKKFQKHFFENAVSSLKLNDETKNIQDPIEKILVNYQFYPNILIIIN